MRLYIARQETPNAATLAAMEELERDGGKRFASADALFRDLGI